MPSVSLLHWCANRWEGAAPELRYCSWLQATELLCRVLSACFDLRVRVIWERTVPFSLPTATPHSPSWPIVSLLRECTQCTQSHYASFAQNPPELAELAEGQNLVAGTPRGSELGASGSLHASAENIFMKQNFLAGQDSKKKEKETGTSDYATRQISG